VNLSDLNDLDLENLGSWPTPIKAVVIILLVAAVLVAGYMLDTKDMMAQLERVNQQEGSLLREFERRQTVVANYDAYKAQLEELQQSLDSMLRQLPTRTEMPDLLENISDTGLINGLVFDRFKPLGEVPQEFYATQPISIRARGTYHQFGSFLSGVSALPRIVTVENLRVTPVKSNPNQELTIEEGMGDELQLEANLATYRYLDDSTVPTGEAAQ